MQYMLALFLVVCASGLLIAKNTAAQQKKAWPVVCLDKSNAKTCRMSQSRYATEVVEGKKQSIKVLTLSVLYAVDNETKERRPHLSIQLPLGLNLPAGVIIKVDQNKQIPLSFLQCSIISCDASIVLNSKLLRSILAGIDIAVAFRYWTHKNLSQVTTPLAGFTESFRKLK